MRILITSQPMIQLGRDTISEWLNPRKGFFASAEPKLNPHDIELYPASQTVSEQSLVECIDNYDAWIIGDDPATRKVLKNAHKLKWIIKWGIGTDNINLNACLDFGIIVKNTPGMFNDEVADVAIGYLIMLSRHLHEIDREVRKGVWHKVMGNSLTGKSVALIGYGNIGKAIQKRLVAMGMKIAVYDPGVYPDVQLMDICDGADCLIVACALTDSSRGLINADVLKSLAPGAYLINVSRGPVVRESDLIENLSSGYLGGVALDVFESEPISLENSLVSMPNCILGSHNASNTRDAVYRTSMKASELLIELISNQTS